MGNSTYISTKDLTFTLQVIKMHENCTKTLKGHI